MGPHGAAPRLMLVSDLDNTMVDHQDATSNSLLRFNALWAAEYAHDSVLVYSTGRSPSLYDKIRQRLPLLTPGILIMSVGTEIVYGDTMEADTGWVELLDRGWDREMIMKEARKLPSLKFQAENEQRPHKISFEATEEEAPGIIDALSKSLTDAGLQLKFIFSGGRDLDILPREAGKGGALKYLLHKFKAEGRSPRDVLACGDSGNDAELFEVDGAKGVIVANAMDELVQWYNKQERINHLFRATERCASGIIQAMQHFKFVPAVSPRDNPALSDTSLQPGEVRSLASAQREVVDLHIFQERWLRGDIKYSEETMLRFKSLMQEGFTAVQATGDELTRDQWIASFQKRYGAIKGKGLRIWIDCMRASEISPGLLWLVKFRYCQQVLGQPREVHVCSAVLEAEAGLPNGVTWVHFHSTLDRPRSLQ
eukprot:TRINITY_DN2660_c0_g1_i1.p1 TRINITY_DN2660_c0_g1~~TRINITY_DN2660_c0_g1_i1.p1  ORF type:complete len:425 (+),score=58.93 TRINITY_DN2660_c0_g1_i1:135-1409(+)